MPPIFLTDSRKDARLGGMPWTLASQRLPREVVATDDGESSLSVNQGMSAK